MTDNIEDEKAVDQKESNRGHSFGQDRLTSLKYDFIAAYSVRHRSTGDAARVAFSNYYYDVFLGEEQVGEITHDFRGDDNQARTVGDWQSCSPQMIGGGGPEPLYLTPEGVALFDRLLGIKRS